MQLQHYLDRITYHGEIRPSVDVLFGLHRAHVCAIPFENFDVHLGRPVSIEADAAYEKIVVNNRGGWCYEQNGLFAWALAEIGFDVTRIAAAVMRQDRGEVADANHLCLQVVSPGSELTYLADVGFGGSLLQPIELCESEHGQAPFRLGLRRLDDSGWRFWEDIGRGEFSFDFRAEAAAENALRGKCDFLQTDPSSGFVLNTVAQIRLPTQHKSLRGRVFSVATQNGVESTILDSPEQLVDTLAEQFSLDLPESADLWPGIAARHEILRAEKAVEDTFEIRDRSNR
jgi:N-hydroxyarylamine O-acetyltransferase